MGDSLRTDRPASPVSLAALVLLFLSVAAVIWPKFACLVRTMRADFRAAVQETRDFKEELNGRVDRNDQAAGP